MTSRFWTLFVHAAVCSAVLSCAPDAAHASSDPSAPPIEPALRDLWVRGSERFQRQWLLAGPVDAASATSIDPASLHPGLGQALVAGNPAVRWTAHTAWSDVTDLNTASVAAIESDRDIDRFIYLAGSLRRNAAERSDLSIGSERPYSVWLNGKLVHTQEVAETFAPDRDRIPVELKQGENLVLVRFHVTSGGASQFAFRAVPPGARLSRIDEITPSLIEPSDTALAVRAHFAAEPGSAPVALEVIAAGGKIVANATATRGESVKFDSQGWTEGAYEVRVSTQNVWKQPSVRHLAWYKGDPTAAVERLVQAASASNDDVRGRTLRMLAALVQDRLGGDIEHVSWRRIHSALMEFEELQLEDRGQQGRVRGGGFVRIAYIDEVDGSTQFCSAYLPLAYASGKSWPLITYLHGYNPANPKYINWWRVDERHNPLADTKGTIYIEAHGRGNAQYTGIGERAVLRCIDEAKRRFSIDPDRVYLTGESMGGHGTWLIASRHPDVFAAAAPVFGGWDFRISNVSGPPVSPPPQTPLEAFAFERMSAFAAAENLLHVPLLVIHGDSDGSVNVENSRHAVRLLQRWGYDIRYHEMPGWGHEDLLQISAIADWLLAHRRVAAPRTVRIRSVDLASASAHWLTVSASQKPAEVIRVAAEVLQPGVVRIDSSNAAALRLELPAALRGSTNTLTAIWNGQTQTLQMKEGVAQLGAIAIPSQKRAGLEGPLPAVITTPFAVVVGTISPDPRMRELIQDRADSLAAQWRRWQHEPLRTFKDTDVSSAEEKAYSLILIGGADANAVTKRLAKKLPFSVSRDGIVVDGRKWHAPDSALQLIYPSPAASDRYVYVIAATSAAGMYFWKPQLVHFAQGYQMSMFDWVIQDGRRMPPGMLDPNVANVAAGVFDSSWRRDDGATVQRDEKRASQWALRRAPPPNFVASPSALQAAVGSYELFPGAVLTFRVEGNSLVSEAPGRGVMRLRAESDSIFVDGSTGDAVEFVRDERGKVVAVEFDDQGSVLQAKRVP